MHGAGTQIADTAKIDHKIVFSAGVVRDFEFVIQRHLGLETGGVHVGDVVGDNRQLPLEGGLSR